MMPFYCNFPFVSILLGLLCAVGSFALRVKAARIVSVVLNSVGFGLSLGTLLGNSIAGEGFVYWMGHYPAPWGNEISAGIVEPLMGMLFSAVMLATLLGGAKMVLRDVDEKKQTLFYVMADLAYTALLALSYTNDIFTGYVFVEICTLSSCSLLMIRRRGKSLVAATRYLIFSLIGSGLFLLGVILLYDITGHLLFSALRTSVEALWREGAYRWPMTITLGLMVSGLAIKSGLYPFHLWMADTYSTATPAASGILSGLISKGYLFLLIKVLYRVIGMEVFLSSGVQYVLLCFGIAGMVAGSVSAIRAKTVNRMIAFSSAAQIGYIYMGIGMGTDGQLLAALYQLVAHAITKPLLFLSADALSQTVDGKQDFASLRGAAQRAPYAGVLFTIGALSMVGIPVFAGFLPKLLFATSAFGYGIRTYAVLAALAISTVLNVIYFLRATINFYLPLTPQAEHRVRMDGCFAVGTALLASFNLLFGLRAQPLIALLEEGIRWLSQRG